MTTSPIAATNDGEEGCDEMRDGTGRLLREQGRFEGEPSKSESVRRDEPRRAMRETASDDSIEATDRLEKNIDRALGHHENFHWVEFAPAAHVAWVDLPPASSPAPTNASSPTAIPSAPSAPSPSPSTPWPSYAPTTALPTSFPTGSPRPTRETMDQRGAPPDWTAGDEGSSSFSAPAAPLFASLVAMPLLALVMAWVLVVECRRECRRRSDKKTDHCSTTEAYSQSSLLSNSGGKMESYPSAIDASSPSSSFADSESEIRHPWEYSEHSSASDSSSQSTSFSDSEREIWHPDTIALV